MEPGGGPGASAGPTALFLGPLSRGYAGLTGRLLQLISTLPEDIRPGPNFHGLPWEPIIITSLVGITTLAIFFWRTCLSVSIF
uniref:Nuclear pore complex interacting protein N-terminal domain-containing protein n=1 Tax=Sphenodon punctatus TaxID=8508 RepID=A0A8D0GLJ4_SPHPU